MDKGQRTKDNAVKRRYWQLAKWTAGLGLIGLIVWLNWYDFLEAANLFRDRKNLWNLVVNLVIAAAICLPCVVLTFYRWYWLVRAQELPFRRTDAVRLGFISYFFSMVLPGAIAGDVVKAGFVAREQHRRTVAIATIFVDRIVGLFGLVVLTSIMGLIYWEQVRETPQLRLLLFFVWAVTGAGFVAVFLMSFFRATPLIHRLTQGSRPSRIVAEVLRALQMYKHKSRDLAVALAMAVVGHVGFVLTFYFCARAVPEETPPLHMHYLIIPVGMVIQSIPLTPGNFGPTEWAFNTLYRMVDPSLGLKGMFVSLANRLVTWFVALIGLGFYLRLRGTVRQVLSESKLELTLPEEREDSEAIQRPAVAPVDQFDEKAIP
jgi:uncharacterized protein (TIRG00374 family)